MLEPSVYLRKALFVVEVAQRSGEQKVKGTPGSRRAAGGETYDVCEKQTQRRREPDINVPLCVCGGGVRPCGLADLWAAGGSGSNRSASVHQLLPSPLSKEPVFFFHSPFGKLLGTMALW